MHTKDRVPRTTADDRQVVNIALFETLRADAQRLGADVAAGINLAVELGAEFPVPGRGKTAERFGMLAALAAGDLTQARIIEPHTDALAILAEAGQPARGGSWGVFAAHRQGLVLTARQAGGRWTLSGAKPWCSLAERLEHCLVTADTPAGPGLFAVDLGHSSITAEPSEHWVSRGLTAITSVGLLFDATPAEPIGAPGWYLSRPGFAWGGIGVAACWLGGATALRRTLATAAGRMSGEARTIGTLALGRIDCELYAAQAALDAAAVQIDTGAASGPAGELLALRVRSVVAAAAENTINLMARCLGPTPLVSDEEHARRVADLGIYLRQHHGERDLIALGESLLQP
jgi:alkylation response protein AidB-like acyl-CoA dehydrogenase